MECKYLFCGIYNSGHCRVTKLFFLKVFKRVSMYNIYKDNQGLIIISATDKILNHNQNNYNYQ